MLIRLSLIVAIVAALAVGVLSFVQVKEKIDTLVTDRNTQRDGRISAETERDTTKAELAKSEKDLKQTKETLAETSAERDKAAAEAASQTKKATELQEKLTKTTSERDTAQADLAAFNAIGLTPQQVLALNNQLRAAQTEALALADEKTVLNREYKRVQNELAKYTIKDWPGPPLPANLAGKIVVCDPKWDFVVLDVGIDQGVLEDGELLVNRNGKLVAKLKVSSVQKDRSIANVVPGWKLGDVAEGDQVIAAHPAL